jgi:hypothetical protein
MAEEEEMSYVTKEEFENCSIGEIKEMIAAMMPQEEEMSVQKNQQR